MTNLELHARTAPRNITVELDPIDAIFVQAALVELAKRHRTIDPFPGRAERIQRVADSIEKAVYGDPHPGGIEQYQSESR